MLLFILNNIEIFGISCNSNKIISFYRDLLNKLDELKKLAEYNYNTIKEEYDKCEHKVWYISTGVSSLKGEISSLIMSSEYDLY